MTIDRIEAGIHPRTLAFFAGLIVAVALFHLIFRFLVRYTIIIASRRIEYDIRNDFLAHLQTLDMSFYHQHKTGDLMARMTNDLNAVRNVVGPGIMHSTSNLILLIFIVSLMLYTNVKLTLMTLVPLPFVTLVSKIIIRYIFTTFKQVQEQYSTMTSKVQENISGVRVVKAYVQEDRETEIFSGMSNRYLFLNLRLTKIRALLFGGISFLMGLGMAFLLWVGGELVIKQTITIGDFVAFTVWLGMLAWPLISFGWIMNMLQQGAASMERIAEVMDTVPAIRDSERTNRKIKTIQGVVEFRNVWLTYPNTEQPTLKDISFYLPAGNTLAIVGPTGSGKSSIINLIPRLYNADRGDVLIDGHEVSTIPLRVLRKHISVVPQETFLFSDTIAENISFGVDSWNGAELEAAAVLSTIKQDLEKFPDKYNTMLGERGITLSGGQKQRTALSRAIMRKPAILILDDAFSAVDSHTEEQILNQFRQELKGLTIIFVAHRISTIMHADEILFIMNGEIVERGTHQQLVQLNGHYASLYNKQRLEADIEAL